MAERVDPAHPKSLLARRLGTFDAMAMYVGVILGSGIFFAPQSVAASTSSTFYSILLWVVGGVIAALGAMTYAEAGARIPAVGGFFEHYAQIFNERFAFMAGFCGFLITFPVSGALIALICAEYFKNIVPSAEAIPASWVAVIMIVASMALSLLSAHGGVMAQRFLSSIKVVALLVLCIVALGASVLEGSFAATFELGVQRVDGSGVLAAIIMVLWSFEGWSSINLLAGELRTPAKSLGLTVLWGSFILTLLYVLVQLAAEAALGHQGAAESSVVVGDAVSLYWPRLGAGVSLLVVVSTFGALQATVVGAARLGFAMAHRKMLPAFFGVVHKQRQAPDRAMVGVSLLCIFYVAAAVLFGTLMPLLILFSFAVWFFYGAIALAVLKMRREGLGDGLQYPMWGSTVAPKVLLLCSVVLAISMILDDPLSSGLGALALGLSYFLAPRTRAYAPEV